MGPRLALRGLEGVSLSGGEVGWEWKWLLEIKIVLWGLLELTVESLHGPAQYVTGEDPPAATSNDVDLLAGGGELAGEVEGTGAEADEGHTLALEAAGCPVEAAVEELAAELVTALEFGHRRDGVLSARRDDGVVGPSLGGGTDAVLILVLVTLDRNGPAAVVLWPTCDGPRAQPHVLHQPEVRGVLPEVLVHLAVAEEVGVAARVQGEVTKAAGVAARVHDHAVVHGRLDLVAPRRRGRAVGHRLVRPLAPDLVARLEELGIEAFGQTFFQ